MIRLTCDFVLVPTRHPYIWYARAISYTAVWIKWERLSQRYVHGILRGYRIYVSLYNYNYYYHNRRCLDGIRIINVGADKDELRISGLRPDTYYMVWIKARTSKGEGSYANNLRSFRTSKSCTNSQILYGRPTKLDLSAYYE